MVTPINIKHISPKVNILLEKKGLFLELWLFPHIKAKMTLQKGKFISINDSDENVEKEELPNAFPIIKN